MSRKLAAALICGAALVTFPAIAQTAKPDFVTQQSSTEWRASKLVGVNVYGEDNQKIGDISEVLLDKSGAAKAVVIGVGGFLGMGQKNVAIPFNELQWEGRSTSAAAGTTTSAASSAERGYPDHAVLHMSKADLQNAPEFKFASDMSSTSGTAPKAPATTAPATSAPATNAPAANH